MYTFQCKRSIITFDFNQMSVCWFAFGVRFSTDNTGSTAKWKQWESWHFNEQMLRGVIFNCCKTELEKYARETIYSLKPHNKYAVVICCFCLLCDRLSSWTLPSTYTIHITNCIQLLVVFPILFPQCDSISRFFCIHFRFRVNSLTTKIYFYLFILL